MLHQGVLRISPRNARTDYAGDLAGGWRSFIERLEGHQEDAVAVMAHRPRAQLRREPGLAGPARTRQREQPGGRQKRFQLAQVTVPADERRRWRNDVRRRDVRGPQWRERVWEAVDD